MDNHITTTFAVQLRLVVEVNMIKQYTGNSVFARDVALFMNNRRMKMA